MDQFASHLRRGGTTRCSSTAGRSTTGRSPCRPDEVALVACHSGSPRKLESSAYNERRRQCEAAVAAIAAHGARRDRPARRDTGDARGGKTALDPVVVARAEHIVEENERVLDTVAPSRRATWTTVGRLFYASHASMRDLFEVSSPELDALVEIASGVPGVIGARMTGGGFGGCTINLVRRDAVAALREAVMRDYPARTGLTPRVFEVAASDGARRVA